MEEHVYKVIELVGSSEQSMEDAVQRAIDRAGRTLDGLGWFEVVETRGRIADGKVGEWQVVLKVGFALREG